MGRVLREHNPDLRLVGVDTIGSTIFGQPASSRLMRGLGSSIYPGNVDYAAFDEAHWVAPNEAVWAARTLAAAGRSYSRRRAKTFAQLNSRDRQFSDERRPNVLAAGH